MSLGAAAILAAGAVPVLAAAPAPESPTAIKEEAGKGVTVASKVTAPSAEAGFNGITVRATATTEKNVVVTLTVNCPEGATEDADKLGCNLEGVTGTSTTVNQLVSVPEDIPSDTLVKVTLTVALAGDDQPSSDTTDVTFTTTADDRPQTTPTPTPTKTAPKPTPTKSLPSTGSGSGSGGGGGGGGSSNNSSGSGSGGSGSGSSGGGSGGSGTGSGSGSGFTPPALNGAFGRPQNPQVSLPTVPPPMSPSVAPQQAPVPQNRLQNNKAPVAQDLTFERMASTQVAWLAALLVAFSLLMTQLRLGRRHNVSVRALTTTARRVGSHRRPRRGMFSK